MKQKLKITLGTAAISLATITPMALVVSCGENEKREYKHKDKNFEQTIETLKKIGIKSYKAEIIDWHDGDTPTVKFLDKKLWKLKGFINENTGWSKIRIASIDTPEIGTGGFGSVPYKPTTGSEYKYAKAGKDLADKLMPKGTIVSIFTTFTDTYKRYVGNIFFDKDKNGTYESSWAVEIMKKGLALPFISSPNNVIDEKNILHYIGIPFADAFNYAYENKIGMFSRSIDEISKTHGSTDITTVKWHKSDDSGPRNIYDYYKAWEESQE